MTQRDRRARFVALAEKRVSRALRDLRLIGNLANRGNYEYSQEDVRQIFSTLDSEMRRIRAAFNQPTGIEAEFRLNNQKVGEKGA